MAQRPPTSGDRREYGSETPHTQCPPAWLKTPTPGSWRMGLTRLHESGWQCPSLGPGVPVSSLMPLPGCQETVTGSFCHTVSSAAFLAARGSPERGGASIRQHSTPNCRAWLVGSTPHRAAGSSPILLPGPSVRTLWIWVTAKRAGQAPRGWGLGEMSSETWRQRMGTGGCHCSMTITSGKSRALFYPCCVTPGGNVTLSGLILEGGCLGPPGSFRLRPPTVLCGWAPEGGAGVELDFLALNELGSGSGRL